MEQKNDAQIYIEQGKNFQQEEKWDEAISAYQQALKLTHNPWLEEEWYLQLQEIYREKAQQNYQNALLTRYLVNHKYKLIYCPIPKNACTLFRTMMIQQSDDFDRYEELQLSIHEYMSVENMGLRLTDFSYLHHPEYFKFVILRNPFERLVSAYLDKIAKHKQPESFAQKLIENVYKSMEMTPDIEQSITFSQLVRYLAKTEDKKINEHWRSQHTFLGLGLFKFDYIGQFEKLDSVLKYLERKFGFQITRDVSKHHNQPEYITSYGNYDSQEKFPKKYPEELRKLAGVPTSNQFFTPELEQLVRERYAADIQLYEEEFKVKIGYY